MPRSSAKSGKAKVTKSLKEKCERSVQSAAMNREKEVGGSSTITGIECMKPPGIKGESGNPTIDGHGSGESKNGLR